MFQYIKTEPSSPGTPHNPVVIPSDGSEVQAIAQDQHRTPTPSSSTATEIVSQFPPSWLQLLKPPAEASASPSSQLNATTSENQTRSVISAPASDSDEEPLMNRRRDGKRAAKDHDEESTHGHPTNSKRQRHDSGTPLGSMSTPAPASSAPAAFLNPTSASSTVVYNGLRVVTAPSNQGKRTEIRCHGHLTFEQAKEYGRHGGNCIFQWPLGIGNPFFILVCQQCSHTAKDRGSFWTHPFEGSQKAGLKHFGLHMTEWQILEHSGWHVTDAREHFEEILHHNSMLAHKPDKQPPKTKLKARHSTS